LLQLIDGKDLLQPEATGAFDAEAGSVPYLTFGIPGTDQQDAARRVAAHDDEGSVGLVKPREIIEIRILAEFVCNIVVSQRWRRREQHQHALPDLLLDAFAPTDMRREVNHEWSLARLV
jgi:hypothetical protein